MPARTFPKPIEAALSEQMTLLSGTVSGNGITAYYFKVGKIVTVNLGGSLPSAKDADTTILTLPDGYRPNRETVFAGWNAAWTTGLKGMYITSDGLLRAKTSLAAGGLFGSVSYVCS